MVAGRAGVSRRARELSLEIGECVDDLRRLVGTVPAADRDLAQDPRLDESLDRVIRGLEGAPDQRRGAIGGNDRGAGKTTEE